MSLILLGKKFETIVTLASSGTGVTGLTEADLAVEIWKPGLTAFVPHTFNSMEVIELGNGFYALTFDKNLVDTLGEFFASVSGTGFDTVEIRKTVEAVPIGFTAAPNICLITGSIVDIGAMPGTNIPITFRAAVLPSESANGSIVSGRRINVYPDGLGNFSVQMIRGTTVVVEIPEAGISKQFDVPDQETAALLDLIAPPSLT